jgi:hypothetical protein
LRFAVDGHVGALQNPNMKTADLPLRNSIQCLFALVSLLLATFWLSARVQAVTPTPDGAYAGANTAEGGSGALFRLTTGTNNTALGSQALYGVTTGSQNTATGAQALKANTANGNTADGFQALVKNTIGTNNTATGWRALFENTIGEVNTATGDSALYSNTTGGGNTATGAQALFSNTIGGGNTGVGASALSFNTAGDDNTAVGAGALFAFFGGESNTATGAGAMGSFTVGDNNTANGAGALGSNDPFASLGGSNNTAVGANALVGNSLEDVNNNTAVGAETLPLGTGGGQNNIAIGYRAGANLGLGDNNIYVGNPGVTLGTESGIVRIGTAGTHAATFIAGISGTAVSGTAVVVDGNGQLGVAASSARFKDEVKPMEKTSEAILALKPVTFRYKKEIDTERTPQFGLVAEEVAKVNPNLVVRDKNGEIYTVRYDAVNAMLLNEFLKEHREVQELKKQIEALTAGLQKVSAQLEAGKPAPQVVTNP